MHDDLLSGLMSAQSVSATWEASRTYFANMGFDSLFYAYGDWDRDRSKAHVALTTLNEGWVAPHFAKLSPETEPLLAHGCHGYSVVPMGTNYLGPPSRVPAAYRVFMERLADSGLRSIATFAVNPRNGGPFGGWALSQIGASAQAFDALFDAHGHEVRLATFFVHERIQMLSSRGETIGLTSREADCLLLLSRGLRSDQIAHRLGISVATVEFHFRNARTKLDASTREQALAKAILGGLIRP